MTDPALFSTSRPGNTSGRVSSLVLFLGGFFTLLLLGGAGAAVYVTQGAPAKGSKLDLIRNTTTWHPGGQTAKPLTSPDNPPQDKPDINWWARTFNLPKPDAVTGYLKNQGLSVQEIEPVHYAENNDTVTITYQVKAEVPGELLSLQSVAWNPADPVLAHFAPMMVLNQGLPAGYFWDTEHATVVARAGEKLNFTWQVHVNGNDHAVTTDRLPYNSDVYTRQQVGQYEAEAGQAVAALQGRIQQIETQTQNDLQARLAQIPADPPKPQPLSAEWGGDGSGEPTKSAARIGGGAAGGAAGGALFGAIAGDAGLGAGIGAGVGLLGGLIYDNVSKDNDKKQHQRAVAAQNAENLENWKLELKSLNQQRTQAKANAVAEKEKALTELGDHLAAALGQVTSLDNGAPTSQQPTGPVTTPPRQ